MKESVKRVLEMPASMTCGEVARKLGVSYASVASARKRFNIDYPRKNQKVCSDPKKLYEMIDQGLPYPAIAKHFNMTAHAVCHRAAKIGHSRVKVWDENLIIEMYKAGKGIKVIEGFAGCSNSVIYRILKKNGVKLQRASRYA